MQTSISEPLVRPAATRTGLYLYAVIECGEERGFITVGIGGAAVRTLSDGRIAAVVSESPNGKIRPERRRLAAHHQVLQELRQQFTVLPISFGVIADDAESVRGILAHNRDAFLEQIQRVAGKVEMGLRVSWDVPNIFEYFLDTHPELRALRDQTFHDGRQPRQDELIDLGRAFDRLLGEDRAAHTHAVTQMLHSRCWEIKENELRGEQEVMNLACLIGQHAQEQFEEGVIEAARRFDNHFSFDFSGPWPPHNFVEVNLDL